MCCRDGRGYVILDSMNQTIKRISPAIPYVAVLIGMYGFGSAWAAIGGYHLGMLAAMLSGRCRGEHNEARGISPLIWLSVVVFAAGGLVFYLIWPYIMPAGQTLARLQAFGITRQIWPYFAVCFCIVNSAIEECFWRGYLRDDTRSLRANDLFFAGYHTLVLLAFASPIWTIPVFAACAFAGWLWRILRSTTGGMALPLITHLAADISIVLAVHFRVFVQN